MSHAPVQEVLHWDCGEAEELSTPLFGLWWQVTVSNDKVSVTLCHCQSLSVSIIHHLTSMIISKVDILVYLILSKEVDLHSLTGSRLLSMFKRKHIYIYNTYLTECSLLIATAYRHENYAFGEVLKCRKEKHQQANHQQQQKSAKK